MINNKRILITGGLGVVGTALAQTLKPANTLATFSRKFVHTDLYNKVYSGDIRRIDSLIGACSDFMPDYIIHAAGLKDVVEAENDVYNYITTNLDGTRNVIVAANDCRGNLTFVSSVAAQKPAGNYGYIKALSEQLVISAGFKACRLGTVLSSRCFLKRWADQIQAKQPIRLTHMDCVRPMLLLSDAAQAILDCVEGDAQLFTPHMEYYELRDVVAILEEIFGEVLVENIGLRPGEKLVEGNFNSTGPMSKLRAMIERCLK